MSDTQDNCPECREFKTTFAQKHPVPTFVVAITILVGVALTLFGWVSAGASFTDWMMGEMSFGDLVGAAIGGILGLGTPCVMAMLHRFIYRPSNAIGYPTYSYLVGEKRVGHTHLKLEWFETDEPVVLYFQGRVGGHKRETKLLEGHTSRYSADTWDGQSITLTRYGEEITTDYRTALHILLFTDSLQSLANSRHETLAKLEAEKVKAAKDLKAEKEYAIEQLAKLHTEFYFLKLVSDRQDPLSLGESPYGKFVHDRVTPFAPERLDRNWTALHGVACDTAKHELNRILIARREAKETGTRST